eukprot:2153842-Rhodomonas_salina.1
MSRAKSLLVRSGKGDQGGGGEREEESAETWRERGSEGEGDREAGRQGGRVARRQTGGAGREAGREDWRMKKERERQEDCEPRAARRFGYLASYAPATGCPVLTHSCLRARYQMSSTAVGWCYA